MSPAEINAIGVMLQSIRHPDERFVTLAFTAHAPNSESFDGSVSVTVGANGDTATSESVTLDCALHMARAKLRNQAEARAKAAAEKRELAA
jgi:hypothetical protein